MTQELSDNGYIITGELGGDIFLIRTDSLGNQKWEKTYEVPGNQQASVVQETPDCGFILLGYTNPQYSDPDVYLLKTDSSGKAMWYSTLGGYSWDYGKSLQQLSDGGFIIAGHTSSFGRGGDDIYLLRVDKDGRSIWETTIGGENNDNARSLQLIYESGYIITGGTRSYGEGEEDVYLVKVRRD
jgi:hypothetical protein